MSWCGGGEISPTPGVECRTRAITASTLWPGSCPPSPGLAPCAILICIMSELTRYSVVTPKRPEATCLIAERMESPFANGLKRSASSPPSPVLDLPPIRFMAIAKVVCASREIEPKLIAPVANRLTISLAGSTCESGTGLRFSSSAVLIRNMPRKVNSRSDCSFRIFANAMLQRRDGFRGPCVVLAAGAIGIFAADIERALVNQRVAERVGVAAHGFFRDLGQAHALDAGVGADEIFADEFGLQSDRVEN